MVFAANFGYSYATSFRIEGNVLSIARDPACAKVRGDGTFRALNGTVSGGAADNWICPTGAFYYQLYPNASKLVGYAIHPDGALEEITSVGDPLPEPTGHDWVLSGRGS